MANFNRVILVGRLTRNPEIKYTPQGTQLAKFSLAVSRIRSKNDEVDFFNIVAWQRLAEICGQYLKKGKLVLIEGEIHTRKYDTQDGQKKTAFDIVAQNMQMLGGRGEGEYEQPNHINEYTAAKTTTTTATQTDEFEDWEITNTDYGEEMPF